MEPVKPASAEGAELIGIEAAHERLRQRLTSGEYWAFVWTAHTQRYARALEQRFYPNGGGDGDHEIIMLVGMPGLPCVTLCKRATLTNPKLRGFLLEQGLEALAGAVDDERLVVALAHSVFDFPVITTAIWLMDLVDGRV